MLKAILFDLDNTLIDFMKIKKECCNSAVDAMIKAGLAINRKMALKMLFDLYNKYGIEYSLIFQRFLEKANTKINYKILAAGITAYRKMQLKLLKPYKGTVRTLRRLRKKGIRLAIISDAPRLKAWIRLTEIGIQDYFDVVVAYGDVKERKPSELPFRKALKTLNLKPSEVLMVGDWPERDIKGAKNLGIKSCFARYGYTFGKIRNSGADYEIDKISDLMGIVNR